MAYARFYRLLALLALLAFAGILAAWAARGWFPSAAGEIAALDAARRAADALAASPFGALCSAWTGRDGAGLPTLLAATGAFLPDPRGPLLALLLPLGALLWAAADGAGGLARRLPTAGGGSVVEVERRLGVGKYGARIQQDVQVGAAWRAVLLVLVPAAVALGFRHLGTGPFAAGAVAAAVALLARTEGFRRRLPSAGVGVVAGVGVLLDPAAAPVLLAGSLLVALAERKDLRARLPHAAVALAVAAVIGAPAVLRLGADAFLPGLPDAGTVLPALGLPAAVLFALGLLGLALGRPGWTPALGCWLGALLSALALPFLVRGDLADQALFLAAPLAVLGAAGWGRWRVLTSPAGTTLLAAGTLAALLGHAQGAGLLALPLGPLAPASDGPRVAHEEADVEALGWLVAPGGAVLDLARTEDGWGGAWLRYLAAVRTPGIAIDWPLEDVGGPFVEAPCLLDRALVIHAADPWFDADQVAVAVARLDAPSQAALRDALALARLCYRVDRVATAPGGARLTYLARRAALADLLRGAPAP